MYKKNKQKKNRTGNSDNKAKIKEYKITLLITFFYPI